MVENRGGSNPLSHTKIEIGGSSQHRINNNERIKYPNEAESTYKETLSDDEPMGSLADGIGKETVIDDAEIAKEVVKEAFSKPSRESIGQHERVLGKIRKSTQKSEFSEGGAMKKLLTVILTVAAVITMTTSVALAKTYSVPKKINDTEFVYKDGKITKIKYKDATYTLKYKGKHVRVLHDGEDVGFKYKLDGKNRVSQIIYYTNMSWTCTYKYDKKSRIIKTTDVSTWDETESVSVTTYEYDKEGHVSSCETKAYENDELVSYTKSTMKNKYKKGKLVETTQVMYAQDENGDWVKQDDYTTTISYKSIKTSAKKYKALKSWIDSELLPVEYYNY